MSFTAGNCANNNQSYSAKVIESSEAVLSSGHFMDKRESMALGQPLGDFNKGFSVHDLLDSPPLGRTHFYNSSIANPVVSFPSVEIEEENEINNSTFSTYYGHQESANALGCSYESLANTHLQGTTLHQQHTIPTSVNSQIGQLENSLSHKQFNYYSGVSEPPLFQPSRNLNQFYQDSRLRELPASGQQRGEDSKCKVVTMTNSGSSTTAGTIGPITKEHGSGRRSSGDKRRHGAESGRGVGQNKTNKLSSDKLKAESQKDSSPLCSESAKAERSPISSQDTDRSEGKKYFLVKLS